ncbi:MAG TPA: ATP-binding protein [Terriglobales bacterium]|nr:ATP-binding protein [Terriglobales bacterium]
MIAPAAPPDEAARLAALREYKILDTDPEQAFDDLTLLAMHVCQAPIAMMSLVDSDRQWFKSRFGIGQSETPREIAFCAHAINQAGTFVVPDAHQDPRFQDNPLVRSDPHIRFYAGSPLLTEEGHALGTLCVIDRVPRQLTREQRDALEALSRQALAQMELRKNLLELKEALAARDAAEAHREELIDELQTTLEELHRVSKLIPLCSACRLNMTIPAAASQVSPVVEGVMQLLHEMKIAEGKEFEIETSIREALANAITHGCREDASKKIQCCLACDEEGEVLITVRDPGSGFDVHQVPNPLQGDNIYRDHGRGIYLINEFMDDVRFARNGAEIQMRKRSAHG